jgi:DNA repair ATPase RecN
MKEIKNADGSRNWEANILLDNIKRLEQENAELKAYKDVNEDFKTAWEELKAENDRLKYELYVTLKEKDRWNSNCNNFYDVCKKQYQTLQEIKSIAERAFAVCDDDCGNANKFKEIIELTKAEEE